MKKKDDNLKGVFFPLERSETFIYRDIKKKGNVKFINRLCTG